MSVVSVSAPAKVNLTLAVGPARPDGYHGVTTVLQALELRDGLTCAPAESLTVEYRPDIGVSGEGDLVRSAAVALAETAGCEPAAAIAVEKRIPLGAGLGGGSSDAAAALVGLAELWGLDLSESELRDVAARLGADVPFFVSGGCALFEGRGESLVRKLPVVAMDVVLAKPDGSVPTARAYSVFDEAPTSLADTRAMLDALTSGNRAAVAAALANDLAEAARTLVPDVGDALAFVAESPGVLGAAVAGSGSCVFGICRSREEAETVASAAKERGWWSAATSASPVGALIERRA